ncbi:MAG: hypothetical protein ACFB5Z_12300 [Elainellaceae cyanobacterium]
MSLFFDLLCAINSPNQRASFSELQTIADALNAIARQHGAAPSEMETTLSILGPSLRAVLQQQTGILQQPADGVVRQLAESETADVLHQIVPPSFYGDLSRQVAARTSLTQDAAKSLLLMLIPTVMHLLDLGAQYDVSNGNLLVSRFLNSDRDADLSQVVRFIYRLVEVPAA